jgi:NAD(P)-dependent dehydrogenase (short-subunit alcohol dehydrogenase family)
MRRPLANKTILLTGAASGIGRACALALAKQGARLALVDVEEKGLAEAVEEAKEAGGEAHAVPSDLSTEAGVAAAVRRTGKCLGALDVLFSNAGVAVVKPLCSTTDEDWEWILGVNVWAPIRLARALLPSMVSRRKGHLVFTASLAGLVGAPGMVAYSTTKFALVGLAESLRLELADSGIDVTAVCPGYVRTGLHRATRYDNEGFEAFLDDPPAWYGTSAERAATVIVDGIARRRPLIVFGPEKVGWWIKRASPAAGHAVARWVARRSRVLETRRKEG